MKNIIEYNSLDIHPGPFSLDKFIESDAPGTLSWLNLEEIESGSVIPPFDSTKLNKQVIPCQRQCPGCRRWQIESSGKTDFRGISNPETR
jgi:hypothetical protein